MELTELLWDEANEGHIARHEVGRYEVVEVVFSAGAIFAVEDSHRSGRVLVFGITGTGRHLLVVLDEPTNDGQRLRGDRPAHAHKGTPRVRGGPVTDHDPQTPEQARDHYDVTEFPLSSLRRVPVNRPGRPQEAFALRLPPEAVEELRQRAEERALGVTQMVREWILDRLVLERRRPGTTDAALWDWTRAAVEDLLPEIVARVRPGPKD